MMDASAEYPSEKSEKDELTILVDKIEITLGGIVGLGNESRDHIEYMRECEVASGVFEYLEWLFIHYMIDPKEFYARAGILEPGDETE